MNLYVLFPMIEEAQVWTSPQADQLHQLCYMVVIIVAIMVAIMVAYLVAYLVGLFYKILVYRKFHHEKAAIMIGVYYRQGGAIITAGFDYFGDPGTSAFCETEFFEIFTDPAVTVPATDKFKIPDLLI
jgi:hypothetical protein